MAKGMVRNWDDSELRNSLIISACLHVAALLLLYFGLPNLFKAPPPKEWKPIPFEIVEIGAITNTNIKKEPEQPKEPPKPPQKASKAEPKPPPEPPKVTEPVKPQPVERKPDIPAEALLPKPKDKPKPIEPPKPAQPPQPDQLASVLKNVAKLKEATESKDPSKQPDKAQPTESKIQAPSLSERLTISEEDMLRRQLSQCWNMPVGARDAENLIVEVLIEVNQDRTVSKVEIVDQLRYNTDGFFRAAADAARRALKHPNCTPLDVPPDKYEQWKTIRFFFDPRDML